MIHTEAGTHCRLRIVSTFDESRSACRTGSAGSDAIQLAVENFPVIGTLHPIAQPADNLLIGQTDIDHKVVSDAEAVKHLRKSFGLGDRAGITVKNEAVRCFRGSQGLPDNADHQVVGNKVPGIHKCFGFAAEGSVRRNGGAKHIACGVMRNTVLFRE